MTKFKIQNKSKFQMPNLKTLVLSFVICALALFWILCFGICHLAFAQQSDDLEFTLNINSPTAPLPKIFKPGIDLSGRGFHRDSTWPQGLAAPEALEAWKKDIGFNGVYRLQYNLWEINELTKDKTTQGIFLGNYESVIKSISDAGGVVILDIFGTPAGLGKVLDRKSPPWDLNAFKELVKGHIRDLSCNKKYNIWYEVWSAPDSDGFFLGRKQEYLNMYRAVAEIVKELEQETKVHIPVGAPSVTWWFQNFDGNTVVTPERSLIYELIKFCYRYRLPLDFITWHAYSTDPAVEKRVTTAYNKNAIILVRDWLSYFGFDRNIPLIVDEWSYDSGSNMDIARREKSNILASYIVSRIINMHEAGLDYQLYFCLEDFQNNKEGVVRNVGLFWFDPESSKYKGGPKAAYNVFRMLSALGSDAFSLPSKINDEFAGVLCAKSQDSVTLLIYNYIAPDIARNHLSRNIGTLNNAERKILLGLIKSEKLDKVIVRELDVKRLRLTNRLRNLLKKAQELNDKAVKFRESARNLSLTVKNLKDDYSYQRFTVDSSCGTSCEFLPAEEKHLSGSTLYGETLSLKPYSVNMIVLKKEKPKEPEPVAVAPAPETKPAEGVAKEAAQTEVVTEPGATPSQEEDKNKSQDTNKSEGIKPAEAQNPGNPS